MADGAKKELEKAGEGLNKLGDNVMNNSAVKGTTEMFSGAFDGLAKFGGGLASNVGGLADGLKDTVVAGTSNLTKFGSGGGGDDKSPLDAFKDMENPLVAMILDMWVRPAFETKFVKLCLAAVGLSVLATGYLFFPLFYCVAVSVALMAFACKETPSKLGWRQEALLCLMSVLSLVVGLLSYHWFPCVEQRDAWLLSAKYARVASLLVFSAKTPEIACGAAG
eukprot:CAMPEP_0173441486 /NCGR_PEP_ID=MMETSP1357-20121228/23986_1 /TAXON_ID=77926 /ORGANISM="Hemiselmis rufescens, Strain PCC563" /LENGTH=221 /DNA_ID=CAMNT_0014407073 /DNA_START=44 /DNA_END=705 /DNA_ORIENTATION=+